MLRTKMKSHALSELAKRTGPPPISWLMQLALSRPKLISLAAGFTDNESLPVAAVRETLAEILRTKNPASPRCNTAPRRATRFCASLPRNICKGWTT